MDLSWIFVIMPYGEQWKERRRTFVQHFPPSNPHIHQPKELQLIRTRLLPQLLKSPERFMEHIRQYVSVLYLGSTFQLSHLLYPSPAHKILYMIRSSTSSFQS